MVITAIEKWLRSESTKTGMEPCRGLDAVVSTFVSHPLHLSSSKQMEMICIAVLTSIMFQTFSRTHEPRGRV
jgi:hypothetical protein